MSLYIDLKYIKLLSPRLSKFKQVNIHSFRFRCIFCGDSKKSESKTRGNVYPVGNSLSYKCFNCGVPRSIGSLIMKADPSLYKEYLFEKYKTGTGSSEPIFKKEEVVLLKDEILDGLKCIGEMKETHPAVEYVASRLIPREKWNRIFYTKRYKSWVNSILPNKFRGLENDNPRLIFPYMNKHGKVFAANARAFGQEEPKYIITKFDENYDVVYGLDTVNWSRKIFVVEGQIDSLFLPNCLAVSGSNFDLDTIRKIKSNCVLIFDNEPRNKQIVNNIYKMVERNYTICLLPESFNFKDINDAIIGGISVDEIVSIISENSCSGLTARINLSKWRKV